MSRPDSWFRFYNTAVDNPKVQRLTDRMFKEWVNLLCVASRYGGKLPALDEVAFILRVKESYISECLENLRAKRLFDRDETGIYTPHDWADLQFKSDVSTERVKRYRERHMKRNETVSRNENVAAQETEQSRTVTVSKDTVRKPRRTRLANDWKPSEADHAVAIGEGLSPDEIAADLAEWREYWTGPEPRDPLKTDWSRTYRKHVKQFASGIIARRARQGQSKANAGVRQSLTAATDSILAKAGFRQAASDNPLRPDRNTWPEGDNPGAGYSGPILDADHWDGGAWTVEGTEGDDQADAGHNGRPGSGFSGLS